MEQQLDEEKPQQVETPGMFPPLDTTNLNHLVSLLFGTNPGQPSFVDPPIAPPVMNTVATVEGSEVKEERKPQQDETPGMFPPLDTTSLNHLVSLLFGTNSPQPPFNDHSIAPPVMNTATAEVKEERKPQQVETPGMFPPLDTTSLNHLVSLLFGANSQQQQFNDHPIASSVMNTVATVEGSEVKEERKPQQDETPGIFPSLDTTNLNYLVSLLFGTNPGQPPFNDHSMASSSVMNTVATVEGSEVKEERKPQQDETPGLFPPLDTTSLNHLVSHLFGTNPGQPPFNDHSMASSSVMNTVATVEGSEFEEERISQQDETPGIFPSLDTTNLNYLVSLLFGTNSHQQQFNDQPIASSSVMNTVATVEGSEVKEERSPPVVDPSDEKSQECAVCQRVICWGGRSRHTIFHQKIFRFKCSICGYESHTKAPVKKHQQMRHEKYGVKGVIEENKSRELKAETALVYETCFPAHSKIVYQNMKSGRLHKTNLKKRWPQNENLVDSSNSLHLPHQNQKVIITCQQSHHDEPMEQCCMCGRQVASRLMNEHAMGHNHLFRYSCSACPFMAHVKSQMVLHISSNHMGVARILQKSSAVMDMEVMRTFRLCFPGKACDLSYNGYDDWVFDAFEEFSNGRDIVRPFRLEVVELH